MSKIPMPQHRASRRTWLLASLAVSAVLIVVIAIAANLLLGTPLDLLVRDPMATMGGHPLTGALSHVGVLGWWTAAVVCVFGGFMLRRWAGASEAAKFLLWAGAISTLLALDDLFMGHDDLLWRHTSIPQRAALAVGVLVVGLFLWRFRGIIVKTDWPLLAVAATLFAMSLGVDYVSDHWPTPPVVTFIEDWLKLVGILTWATFWTGTTGHLLDRSEHPAAGARSNRAPL